MGVEWGVCDGVFNDVRNVKEMKDEYSTSCCLICGVCYVDMYSREKTY